MKTIIFLNCIINYGFSQIFQYYTRKRIIRGQILYVILLNEQVYHFRLL